MLTRRLFITAVVSGCWTLAAGQTAGSCIVFPGDNIWNSPVDKLPVDGNSAAYIQTIGASVTLHPDFGSGQWNGGPIGIPFVAVSNQTGVRVTFDYSDESDPGPYPVPPDAPIEGGPNATGDRHVLVVDQGNCMLYELYAAYPQADGSWKAGSGAVFDLKSNRLRPAGWTSADAAGLPILPGLVRYEEILAGEIKHAIRFTAPQTRRAYVWPARHFASSLTDARYPPMGQRFRLRADFDISGYPAADQVVLRALKKYGMMLADNGSAWYIGGAPDSRWDNSDLHLLDGVKGSDFEAVDVSGLMADPDSAQVKGASALPAITSVVNSASFQTALAPGAWITVFGANLAQSARTWRADEILDGKLPLQLDGVSVTAGGLPAAVSYISPVQINLQVPDVPVGEAQLAVATPLGSASTTVTIGQTAPALFVFDAENRKYAAAQHAEDYSIVGKAGLYAGSSPARRGKDVILYGTGFGPTDPPAPAGIIPEPAPLAGAPTVTIGGVPARLIWAGISGPGLDQINLTVPVDVPEGDAEVVVRTVEGLVTQSSVYLTIAE